MKKLGIALLLPAGVALAVLGWGARHRQVRQKSLNAQLLQAGERNDWPSVRLLLLRGANPNTTYDNGHTVLYKAAISNQIDLAREMISQGADVTITNSANTPLTAAVAQDNYEMVKLLLDSGADKLLSKGSVWTPLHLAVRQPNVKIAELLIQRGADVNCPRPAGTALILAARTDRNGSNRAVIELLLAHRADPHQTDCWGYTALNWATLRRNRPTAELLLAQGAKLTIFDAIALCDWQALKEMVELRPDLLNKLLGGMKHTSQHAMEYEAGISPLDAAVVCGQEQVLLWLLQKCANPDGPADAGGLPLRTAVREGTEQMTQALIQAGADVNLTDTAGWTALHWAAATNRPQHAKLLLRAGARVNFIDNAGRTPLNYARRGGGDSPVAALLRDHGAVANRPATDQAARH